MEVSPEGRACARCGSHKEAPGFYRMKDGKLSSYCRACTRAATMTRYVYAAPRPARPKAVPKKWADLPPEARATKTVYKAAWRRANPERLAAQKRRHHQANRGYYHSLKSLRERDVLQACPAWADRRAINAIYAECRSTTMQTGIPHHVDHIVPLRGKTVCGLHVPWNLQVLPAAENLRKSNRLLHD